jgi:hypothetical protein
MESVMAARKGKYPDVPAGYVLIFRRYRTTASGEVLDARAYGLKAWPILVPSGGNKR